MARRPDGGRWERILDGVEQYLEEAPADEILEDVGLEAEDPREVAAQVRSVLKGAVRAHQQEQLIRTRESYEREAAALTQQEVQIPSTPQTRRNWLAAVFEQRPGLVFQNRNFAELTDEDVEAHLRKLAMLGLLEDIKLPDSDD